jgi:aspartyl/glutamyl-tRNA(Asn/Gln) amidotransferase C subunit
MAISLDEVNRIAKLARLSFDEDQKQKLQHELSAILDYVDQLKQVEAKTGKELWKNLLHLKNFLNKHHREKGIL